MLATIKIMLADVWLASNKNPFASSSVVVALGGFIYGLIKYGSAPSSFGVAMISVMLWAVLVTVLLMVSLTVFAVATALADWIEGAKLRAKTEDTK